MAVVTPETTRPIHSIAIVGVGLIGASFGLAIQEAGFRGDVIGVSSPGALEAGLATGAITRTASLSEAAACVALIYLAQPVDRILKTIETLARLVKPGTLVTDAGSTKLAIVSKAAEHLPNIEFLGGHPMAGKEQRGAEAAAADLFRGHTYVLTPHAAASSVSNDFRRWLQQMGTHIVELEPAHHDWTVAFSSHLPQVLSTVLAITLAAEKNAEFPAVSGTGLRDMCRLAHSSPELWESILNTNKAPVLAAIRSYAAVLDDLHTNIESGNVVKLFQLGMDWANQIRD